MAIFMIEPSEWENRAHRHTDQHGYIEHAHPCPVASPTYSADGWNPETHLHLVVLSPGRNNVNWYTDEADWREGRNEGGGWLIKDVD